MIKGVLLNSHQNLRPSLSDSWVSQTKEAVTYCRDNNIRLISSFGMSSWELMTALGSSYNLPMTLFIYGTDKEDVINKTKYYTNQFDLKSCNIEFKYIIDNSETDKSELLKKRDIATITHADLLIPVCIRENGRLANLIKINSDKQIIDIFKTEYKSRSEKLKYSIELPELNKEILSLNNNYLIHWTRSFNSAWPNEQLLDYYLAIASNQSYPRTAYDSLENIISKKTIFGSSKNIKGQTKVVAFSNQTIEAMLPLFKWRARYQQMSFEPYGIAIKKEIGLNLGIKPVEYYKIGHEPKKPIGENTWVSQSNGKISDWKKEMEFRFKGDFDLQQISKEDILMITRYKKEADLLNKQTGYNTISLTNQ